VTRPACQGPDRCSSEFVAFRHSKIKCSSDGRFCCRSGMIARSSTGLHIVTFAHYHLSYSRFFKLDFGLKACYIVKHG
jgi:hypothetical protein